MKKVKGVGISFFRPALDIFGTSAAPWKSPFNKTTTSSTNRKSHLASLSLLSLPLTLLLSLSLIFPSLSLSPPLSHSLFSFSSPSLTISLSFYLSISPHSYMFSFFLQAHVFHFFISLLLTHTLNTLCLFPILSLLPLYRASALSMTLFSSHSLSLPLSLLEQYLNCGWPCMPFWVLSCLHKFPI